MVDSNGFANLRRGLRLRVLMVSTALLVVFTVAPSVASATLRTHNVNDPAGDQTVINYRVSGANLPGSEDFQLAGDSDHSIGPAPGIYTIQAFPPAGWKVEAIQCVGSSPAVFQIDVPNGTVTINHAQGAEDTCTFTNGRASASGASGPPSSGIAPSPPASELPKVTLPKKAALLKVTAGLRFASATVRITRSSIIKGQLLWRGKRVVASVRTVRAAGTHVVRLRLTAAGRRFLRRQRSKRVALTLRLVVTPRNRGNTQVFRFGVRVRL